MGKKRNKKTTSAAISDRTAKSARPWNEPEVVSANTAYGMSRRGFGSYKKLHAFENAIEEKGILEKKDRFTCGPCGQLKKNCKC